MWEEHKFTATLGYAVSKLEICLGHLTPQCKRETVGEKNREGKEDPWGGEEELGITSVSFHIPVHMRNSS